MNLTSELQRLREQNKDLALILDTFTAIDHAYRESLKAMGQVNGGTPVVKSSAEVTLSINPSISTANHWIAYENV